MTNKTFHAISIDPEFDQVINGTTENANNTFYLSIYATDESEASHYYKINHDPSTNKLTYFEDSDTQVETTEVRDFRQVSRHHYEVRINEQVFKLWNCSHRFATKQQISSVAIISESKAIIGTTTGQLGVYDVLADSVDWTGNANAHFGDIIHIVPFPSGSAILTIGIDMRCRVWPLINEPDLQIGSDAARTMVGHTARIAGGVRLIGKGRNFVTGGDDGAVNLYECGSGEVIHQFRRIGGHDDPVKSVVIDSGANASLVKADHFECEGKVLFVAYKSGHVQGFSVGEHYQIGDKKWYCGVEISSMVVLESQKKIVSGHDDGSVRVWDISTSPVHLLSEFRVSSGHGVQYLTKFSNERDANWRLVCYNGPDTMIRMTIDRETLELASVEFMVGMPPSMQVSDVVAVEGKVAVVADGEVYYYE